MDERTEKLLALLREFAADDRKVYFHDIDCDDCVYNFAGVVEDEKGDIEVQLTMWEDRHNIGIKN